MHQDEIDSNTHFGNTVSKLLCKKKKTKMTRSQGDQGLRKNNAKICTEKPGATEENAQI